MEAVSSTERAHKWLEVLAGGALADWDGLVSPEFSMHAPLMPGEAPMPTEGRDTNRARVGALWQAWESFEFTDVDMHAAADDPDLVFVTARSQATTVWGAPYRNRYFIRLRFRDGTLVEHLEFMDPRPVLEAFEGHL
ncbi:nuclear transport factor 2 family protein [Mycobacterium pinniadriaticum]|uniref:Nuclear transport factor 2 family protein n=1 Tax=Mycobacterium pinniadriaticum TaxID=2994102 RepID=A0ABT3SAB9_9MYCO|nr:nuclear transport factor 2 family protein [Mycobacterium pinniadriaticum]MCX2936446.1 nuclear transport factor 2 family protein [Mycobacterium pinniadriaticum]